MDETRSSIPLIGSDGELLAPLAETQDISSVYAALPQLFLLDPRNEERIVGKKGKTASPVKQRLNWKRMKRTLIQYLTFYVVGFGLGFFFMVPSSKVAPGLEGIGRRVETGLMLATMPFVLLGGMLLLTGLLEQLDKWQKKRRERRLWMHGRVLRGEVIRFRKLPHTAVLAEVEFRFINPKGYECKGTQQIPCRRNAGTDKKTWPVQMGTPVAILYQPDDTYQLL